MNPDFEILLVAFMQKYTVAKQRNAVLLKEKKEAIRECQSINEKRVEQGKAKIRCDAMEGGQFGNDIAELLYNPDTQVLLNGMINKYYNIKRTNQKLEKEIDTINRKIMRGEGESEVKDKETAMGLAEKIKKFVAENEIISGIVIAGVVILFIVLVGLLFKKRDVIQIFIEDKYNVLKEKFGEIKSQFDDGYGSVMDSLTSAKSYVASAITEPFETIKTAVEKLIEQIDELKKMGGTQYEKIVEELDKYKKNLKEQLNTATNSISKNDSVKTIKEALGKLSSVFQEVIGFLTNDTNNANNKYWHNRTKYHFIGGDQSMQAKLNKLIAIISIAATLVFGGLKFKGVDMPANEIKTTIDAVTIALKSIINDKKGTEIFKEITSNVSKLVDTTDLSANEKSEIIFLTNQGAHLVGEIGDLLDFSKPNETERLLRLGSLVPSFMRDNVDDDKKEFYIENLDARKFTCGAPWIVVRDDVVEKNRDKILKKYKFYTIGLVNVGESDEKTKVLIFERKDKKDDTKYKNCVTSRFPSKLVSTIVEDPNKELIPLLQPIPLNQSESHTLAEPLSPTSTSQTNISTGGSKKRDYRKYL